METLYLSSHIEAVEAILEKAKRTKGVPVRKSFVQRITDGKFGASMLAELVRRNDERGLDLYLLFLAAATAKPWTVTFPAMTWARALNLHQESRERNHDGKRQRPPSGMVAISKTWKRLADHKLIERTREHGWSTITALREDGSGEPLSSAKKKSPFSATESPQMMARPVDPVVLSVGSAETSFLYQA